MMLLYCCDDAVPLTAVLFQGAAVGEHVLRSIARRNHQILWLPAAAEGKSSPSLVHVQSNNMEEAGFVTSAVASYQVAFKMFWGAIMSSIFEIQFIVFPVTRLRQTSVRWKFCE